MSYGGSEIAKLIFCVLPGGQENVAVDWNVVGEWPSNGGLGDSAMT